MTKKRGLIVIGTRPEAIKLIPLYRAFSKDTSLDILILSTGQHKEMLDHLFRFYDISIDMELNLMEPNQTLGSLTSRLFRELDKALDDIKPDIIFVQGDTTTAMVAAMSAYYKKIKMSHVEAGLRTYDKYAPFPEEVNRKVISCVADFHFCPTEGSKEALKREGVVDNVFVVGNTVIDSLLFTKQKVIENENYYAKKFADILDKEKNLILVTGHRRENFGEGFRQICEALKQIATKHRDLYIIYPVHLNPNVVNHVQEMLKDVENIHLIKPVIYEEMVFLMLKSYLIITDSGGVQEEAPSLSKPVIVMRDVTERPEGIEAGCSVLAGASTERIVSWFEKIYTDKAVYRQMSKGNNPYGEGDSAEKIVAIIKDLMDAKVPATSV